MSTDDLAPQPVPVVAAVIRSDDGCILLARRNPGGPHGGLWEFPGGKVEAGECLPDALNREIREELGVEIEVGAGLAPVDHDYPHVSIRLWAFECRIVRGEPRPLDCWEVAWVPASGLLAYPMPAADEPVARRLSASTR
jgi:mutator protein MutT